ncbi:MAG: hypothetical protein AB1627_01110 [Chloroflexota bacterium]
MRRAFLTAAILALVIGACSGGGSGPAAVPDSPTSVPTPAPTIDLPIADPLAGTIEFGASLDEENLEIEKRNSKFKTKSRQIAWVAHLSEPAGATSLTLILASRNKAGVEKTLIKTDVDVADPAFDTLGNAIDLALLVDRKAGTYVMRYLRDATLLAEGTFTLVK